MMCFILYVYKVWKLNVTVCQMYQKSLVTHRHIQHHVTITLRLLAGDVYN